MPYYDFLCKDCQKEFNVFASITQMSEGDVPCPHCQSKNLEVLIKKAPAAHIKGENTCPNAHVCGGCCHQDH